MRIQHWWYTIPLRLRSLFWRAEVERELDEELQFHLEQQVGREITSGKTPEEAHYAALRAMQGLEQRKEECRDTRRVNLIDNLRQDALYAGRSLGSNRSFAAVAILSLEILGESTQQQALKPSCSAASHSLLWFYP